MRITEVNLEVTDAIEAKIWDILLEVKTHMAEVKEIKTCIKANIKMMAIKALTIRVIEDFIIIHIEIFLKVTAMDNLGVEAMVKSGVIIMDVVAIGPIIEVMLIINTISIMVMMMSTRWTNMAHLVLYAETIITPPKHCFKREHDISDIMEKMNINGHQSQSSSLYS